MNASQVTTIPGKVLDDYPFSPSQGTFNDEFTRAVKKLVIAYWSEISNFGFEDPGTFHLVLSIERGEEHEIRSFHKRRVGD